MLSDDEYPNDFNFAAEQDNKSPKPSNAKRPPVGKREADRDSIAEFEKLEQEVSRAVAKPSPGSSKPERRSNKMRKKLFDDSDSEEEEEEPRAEEKKVEVLVQEEPSKSAVVKKFFYKEAAKP